jgi:hypothetical protein
MKRFWNKHAEPCAKQETELKKGFLCSLCDVDSQQYFKISEATPSTNDMKFQIQACDWLQANCVDLYALLINAIVP